MTHVLEQPAQDHQPKPKRDRHTELARVHHTKFAGNRHTTPTEDRHNKVAEERHIKLTGDHHTKLAGDRQIPNRPSRKTAVLAILAIGLCLLIAYGTIALTTRDPIWFTNRFKARPVRIVVYHHNGGRTELYRGHPDFDPLARAIQECLSRGLERPSSLALSAESVLAANAPSFAVEAYFYQPVKLHTWFDTVEPTRILIPITNHHDGLSPLILGDGDGYLASPPLLKTIEPLRQTLDALGYD